jgi:hypothetical protein
VVDDEAEEYDVEDRLLFVIGSPRSGSTLLARMLGAHSRVHAPVETHLLTPLAHLGFYERVDSAPYDPVISQRGIREVVRALPGGEADYLAALRAYCNSIYESLLAGHSAQLLLEKTPAYALVLDFVARLYPRARYVVLTRHPMAIWSSYVQSFFDGDHEAAHAHNPLLERYVPAIGRFLRERPVPVCHVRYEELVQSPEIQLARICELAGIDFEPGMVRYGEQEGAASQPAARGLGDPMTVARETRPTTASLARWARDLSGCPDKVAQCQRILDALSDSDLELWGYGRRAIQAELTAIDGRGPRSRGPRLSRHTVERRLLVLLRRNIHHNAFGRLVRKLREICDVLLR